MILLTALLFNVSCSKISDEEIEVQNNSRLSTTSGQFHSEFPDVDGSFQAKANEYITKINEAFSSTPGRNRNGIKDYPGYYGGAYVGANGKMVVLIKGNISKEKQNIVNIVGSDDFITLPCKHSYKTLVKIMDDLNEFKLNKANTSKSANFKAYGLMDDLNQVTVQLDEFNDKKIAEFEKDVMKSPAIVFVKSFGPLVELSTLKPGCFAQAEGSSGSYAFRATRNSDGAQGMVTSGHLFSVGEGLFDNGIRIGTCSISQNSGSVDAAFVPITDNVTYFPSNILCGTSDILSTTTTNPGVGTIVNMRGQTTGYSSGKILSTNQSVTNPDGTVMTNLTSADYVASEGDSGGIIYTFISSSNTRPTVGIVKGRVGSTGYFSKASLTLSALGVSRY